MHAPVEAEIHPTVGPEIVQLFLPQRRPFLMLDRLQSLSLDTPPTLHGCRYVSANEPVFEGHFPGRPILPGAMILEGLAQCCAVLAALVSLQLPERTLWAELVNLERGLAHDPAHDAERAQRFRGSLQHPGAPGVAGATSLKFIRPVRPGCRLDYRVSLTRQLGQAAHFSLTALVDGVPVTRGSLTAGRLSG
jgi:3-hydroxyacyl-[acyl-carrier-protein] dehydratase